MVFKKFKGRVWPRSRKGNDKPGETVPQRIEGEALPGKTSGVHAPPTGLHGSQRSPSGPSGNQTARVQPAGEQGEQSSSAPKDIGTPIRELWSLAYEKLREEDENLIVDYEAKLSGNLAAGLDSALGSEVSTRDRMETILRHKMDEVNRDVWKLKFGSSETQVKDLVRPILGVINRANDFIAGTVSASPYASMAWAGVSVILPLFLNPSKQGASLAKGLEYISSLIVQSRMREDLYSRRYESKTDKQEVSLTSHTIYKDALEKLYRQILRFQATSYCYYANNAAFRVGLDIIKWNDWDVLLEEITKQESAFGAVNNLWRDMEYNEECLAAEKRQQEALRSWEAIGTDISGLREAIENAQRDKERTELLNWLCRVDPSEMYNTASDKCESGTGVWLVKDSEQFKIWKRTPKSLLWLHGTAGSGKSILSSSVIKHLQDGFTPCPETALAYFFFSFSDSEKQKAANMLASLVKQLYASRPDTPQAVKNLYEYKEKGERPDTKTLETVLIATIHGFSSVFIVIDALDECPTLNRERKTLLDSLGRITTATPDNLHLFCTSRAEPDIRAAISKILFSPSRAEIDLTSWQNRERLDRDIGLYIDSTFESADFSSWPENIRAEAKASLIQRADGMFQYVFCQLEALRNLASAPPIRAALQNLPMGLDATYDRILENIDSNFQTQVVGALKWLAASRRLLRLAELADIFILQPERAIPYDKAEQLFEPEDCLKYMSNLVVTQQVWQEAWYNGYDHGYFEPYVRLAHFSVKEYLMSNRTADGPAAQFSFTDTDAHLHIAHSCLAYHLHCAAGDVVYNALLEEYAASHWAPHLEMVTRDVWPADVVRLAGRALAVRSQSLRNMLRRQNRSLEDPHTSDLYRFPDRMLLQPQCYTARLGFVQLTDMLLSSPITSRYLTQEDLDAALQDAAFGGKAEIVQLLLTNGANANAESEESGDALRAAVHAGHEAIVRILLDSGADPNVEYKDMESVLQVAAAHCDLQIVQLLVRRGADVNKSFNGMGCALASAVSYSVANVPIDEEAPIGSTTLSIGSTTTSTGSTTTYTGRKSISWSKPIECLQFLLDNGADIQGDGGEHGTALHKAAAHLDEHLKEHFRLLLARGANVNAQGGMYGHPLQAVCVNNKNHLAEMELLLDRGADVNAEGGKYGSALQAACAHYHPQESKMSVIQLLIDRGADVNAEGGGYGSALQAACAYYDRRGPWLSVVELLINRGADVNARGGYFETALQAACTAYENEDLVQFLLDNGADVNIAGGMYGNALQAAARNPFYRCIEIERLVDEGADVNASGGRYGSALQAAAAREDDRRPKPLEVVGVLLSRGADVNKRGGHYGTALQAACKAGNSGIVLMLLEHGADVNAQGDGIYGTALQAACTTIEPTDIPRLLLDHAAVVHIQGGLFGSAWHAAAANDFPKHVASYWPEEREKIAKGDPWETVLQLLLDHGVDVNDARGRQYATALQAALEFEDNDAEHVDRVRFLLDRGADVNLQAGKYGFPLQSACSVNHGTVRVKFLLENCLNIDVNAQGGIFGSALQAAAYSGQTASVTLLLNKGANVNMRGGDCGSALNAAIFRGFWDIAEVLLDAGATPDCLLLPEPDEEWLAGVREEDGRGAVERYRKFWEKHQD